MKSWGTTLEPPHPLPQTGTILGNKVPWGQSGVCLLCEKTWGEMV